ncbi:gastrin/cholecystokinin-like peptide [Apteryx mantelli]|uniref:Gastrin/cholecystokinin-like peptide n=1 Tax=Apteryx mantelli TaxID=2696672 RepID=A0ABM4FSE9_9AVES
MKRRVCFGLVLAAAAAACLARPATETPRWPRAAAPRRDRDLDRDRDQPEQQHLVPHLLPHLLAGTAGPRRPQRRHPQHHHRARAALSSPFAPAELSTHHGDEGSEALHDLYYYPGWMDFGRRSAEDLAGVA